MKRILRSIVNWLDRKFPDKVVLTEKEYRETAQAYEQRFKAIENEINKFNVSLGFGGTISQKMNQPFQR